MAIPLFIIAGNMMSKGRLAEKIFNTVGYFLGDKKGFLPIATIVTCMIYGAISGSGPATVAAVAGMMVPLLLDYGYDKTFIGALIASAGSLGMVIPPSLPLMLYGSLTNLDINSLFKISFVIGASIGLLLIIFTYIYCLKHEINNEKIIANVKELKSKGFKAIFLDSIWALLTPVIILGGIFTNIFNTTEAAAVSFVYAILVCVFIYKTMTWKEVAKHIINSFPTIAGISMLLAVASSFGQAILKLNGPQIIGQFITSVFSTPSSFFTGVLVTFLITGMFMDGGGTLAILTPILYPIISNMGINPLIFGCTVIVIIAVGLVTPPYGLSTFVMAPLTGASVIEIGKKAIPFLLLMVIAAFIFTFVPQLTLWVL
ncbi:MAG: TRAP transporter large permease [Thermoanaerobacteraceae bacterium]|nr:TRAP transporter large permease [Thermoanaerobacteraceae bacterium]